MRDERRRVDALEVLGEVGLGERAEFSAPSLVVTEGMCGSRCSVVLQRIVTDAEEPCRTVRARF